MLKFSEAINESKDNKLQELLVEFFSTNESPLEALPGFITDNNLEFKQVEREMFNLLKSFFYAGHYFSEGRDIEFDKEELEIGTEWELEHTTSRLISKRIAQDHLVENKKYYSVLKKALDNSKYSIKK